MEIERIRICDGGASDHVEVAIDEDVSRGIENTISWHEVSPIWKCAAPPYIYVLSTKTRIGPNSEGTDVAAN